MRNAFAEEITELAAHDERIVLLSADIGNRLFDNFKKKYPQRFYNCGVAEANMIGVAAGLAMTGLRPICYTIANFITYRCLEQIRIDLCYHSQPVILVGTGGGLSYASLGATHHSCEEIGMLRLLPNLVVMAAGDAYEVRSALRGALKQDNPVYLRIGKKGEPLIHNSIPDLQIGRGILMKAGTDICIISSGSMLPTAMKTAQLLDDSGKSTAVVSFPTIKPLDKELLFSLFKKFSRVATMEEHSLLGGLGGSIAEWLAEHPHLPGRLIRFGTRDEFLHQTGNQAAARSYFDLTPKMMAQRIEQ